MKIYETWDSCYTISGTGRGFKSWKVIEKTEEVFKCELISTNLFMYSGSGVFTEFTDHDVNKIKWGYKIELA
jgi:hypothetical protein